MRNIKSKTKSFFAVLLTICVLIGTMPIEAIENNENKTDNAEQVISTTEAPENYVPVEENKQFSYYSVQKNSEITDKKVVLIQDTLPWDTNSNEELLNKLGIPYDKVTTQNFLMCDLSQYAVVIFANDQKFSAYDNYKEFKEYLELFTELGGVIVFGAADIGWAGGSLVETLPGGVQKTSRYVYNNYIADNTHPIIKGNLSDNDFLLDEDLYEYYVSHSCFVESSLPAGSKILLRDSDRNEPTLVEYPLGDGRVIASGLTWEFSYSYALRGKYARKAFDDLFLYALQVSSINQHDVTRLKEYWLNKSQHTIAVIASDSKEGIEGAKVKVDGNTYITDENGLAKIPEVNNLKIMVEVEADGYYTSEFKYTLQVQKAHIFILNPKTDNIRPYCTMVEEESKEYDLYTEKIYYMEDETTVCNLLIGADWRGKTPGEFVLYQEGELGGEKGIFIRQKSGKFTLVPGKTFNPGQPVKLKLIAEDGTESIPIQIGIVINKNAKIEEKIEANGDLMNQTSLTIGSPQNGTINDDKIAAVFPNNFNFKVSSLPIEVKGINNSKDGTYTVRMQIGVWRSNYLDKETEWNTFKKDIDKAASMVDKTDYLAGLMQAYDSQLSVGSFSVTSEWKPSLKGMGYYEQTYDAEGNIVSQKGGLMLSGGGTYSNTRQFLAGPVPIYLNLTGSVDFNTSQGLKYGADGFEYDGQIKIIPSLTLSGGLGIKGVASVGVGGGASLNIQIQPSASASITLRAFIEASLIFVFNYSYDIGSTTIPLWSAKEKMNLSLSEYLSNEEPSVGLADTEYAKHTTDWNQSVIEKNKIVSLQDYILPGTVPIIEQIDDKTILVFQATDSSREQINSTVLMYSVFENGYFSIPEPVSASESADLFASVINYDDDVYLVWQKQGMVTNNQDIDTLLAEALSKTEIYFSKWNRETNQFDSVTAITDNDTMDMLPCIAVKDNELSVVWVNSNENNPYGLSGEYSIMKSVYKDNVWSVPQKIYSTNEFISELSADYDMSGELSVAFAAYDAVTQDFSEIYILNDSGSLQITDNESEESGLQFFENNLYWECDGLVEEYHLTDGTINHITIKNDVVTSSFKILKSDSKVAICWTDGKSIKASLRKEGQWSKAIKLCEDEDKTINNMDALLLSDGSWLTVMNVWNEEDDKTSICTLNEDIQSDISLDYVYASDSDRDDGIQPVEFGITNHGENMVSELNIIIRDKELTYLDKKVSCNIAPGESYIFTEEFALDKIDEVKDFDIEVIIENETDYSNNIQSFQLGLTDISISVNQHVAGNDIILAVGLSNLSGTSAQTTLSIIEDNEEGIVLDMKNIGTLVSEDEVLYLYSINKDSVDFSDKNAKHYYIKADTNIADYDLSNNSKYIVVYPEVNITPSDEEMREIELVNTTGVGITSQDVTLILSDESKVTKTLSALVYPRNATYQQVEWSVENSEIVSITEDGTVTGLKEGKTVVTAKTIDSGFTDTINITVLKEEFSTNNVKIYFSNNKNWNNVYAYCYKDGTNPVRENVAWPGVLMTYKTQNIYNEQVYEIEVDANLYDYIIFSDGSQQTVDIPITGQDNVGYYITNDSNNKYNVASYEYSDDTQTIYFTDNYNWENIYAYCFKAEGGSITENQAWPGQKMTYVKTNGYGEKIYAITIPKNKYDYIIFSNGSNDKQTIDISLEVPQNTGFYISGNQNNKYTVSTYLYS